MEITGNKFAREAFNELGIQKTAGIYDYDSPLIQKYKNELANKVKELLEMEELRNCKTTNNENTNSTTTNETNLSNAKKNLNNNSAISTNLNSNISSSQNINQVKETNVILNREKQEENKPDVKFTDFKIENKESSTIQKKPETKISKTSKIKKVDFDFDFDSFNDINFSNFENNNSNTKIATEKKEDPFASFDEKKNEETNDYSNNGGNYLNENNISSGDYLSKNNNIVITDKIRQEADKKFANKKAVGWEDYANL